MSTVFLFFLKRWGRGLGWAVGGLSSSLSPYNPPLVPTPMLIEIGPVVLEYKVKKLESKYRIGRTEIHTDQTVEDRKSSKMKE